MVDVINKSAISGPCFSSRKVIKNISSKVWSHSACIRRRKLHHRPTAHKDASADKKQQFEIQVIELFNQKLPPLLQMANPLHSLLARIGTAIPKLNIQEETELLRRGKCDKWHNILIALFFDQPIDLGGSSDRASFFPSGSERIISSFPWSLPPSIGQPLRKRVSDPALFTCGKGITAAPLSFSLSDNIQIHPFVDFHGASAQ